MVREWETMGAYVRGLPLVKRVQIRLSPADLARELFLQTQRDEAAKLACNRCGKKLSRKTARQINGEIMCSTCMFASPPQRHHGTP